MRLRPPLWSWFRDHPLIGDVLLAMALLGVSIVTSIDGWYWDQTQGTLVEGVLPGTTRAPDAQAIVLIALFTLPIALRRRWPLLLLALTSIPICALIALGYTSSPNMIGILILVYSAAAYRGLGLSLVALALAVIPFAVGGTASGLPVTWRDHLLVTMITTFCWVGGRSLRLRRAYLAELVDRAERLERAREADTRAARAEERSRIARELHDVVAHHVSVMTVQAAAARRMLGADPEVARDALSAIEETGRTAMSEMRDIVGVLRTDGPAERSPQPGMGDLPSLIEQMREAGLSTQLWVEGEPRVVPPGLDLAAYRLVQEALTNSLRHAGPAAHAWVTVRREPGELTVQVEDDGRGAAANKPRLDQQGHGLVGIKERVALYGGILRIGPRLGGGFEVRAQFPLKDSP